MSSGDPRQVALSLVETGDVSLFRLWLHYWRQGGNACEMELDAFIHGVPLLDAVEADILSWALEVLSSP
ncbi:hypothetical protein [Arthrobacter sp. ISL-30]|uniref:hypothetical protein n=1 Tax=Arthrobacter sp. ISL-30 TaxID=2819109 RepID=UPI001BEAA589|nr:hypothetical protein [Arthrobacter sp. ISL-30]MBT2515449.1 hypothetical protein [Arthrobacter sp. ISL-30]